MVPNYEKRHFFMAIGIGVFMVSPLLLLFIPAFIANSIYFDPGTWIVIVPTLSYYLYGAGAFLIGVASLIIYFGNVNKLSVMIGIFLSIVGIFLFLFAAKPFTSIAADGISIREDLSNEFSHYDWSDIETVLYYEVPRSEGFNTYEFHFYDGRTLQLSKNGYMDPYHRALLEQFQEHHITFKRK